MTINRREFVSILGAGAASLIIGPAAHGEDIPTWMQAWCDDKDCKYDLSRPFVIGGFAYATNGYAAVRVPTRLPDTRRDREPPAHKLAWDADRRYWRWPVGLTRHGRTCMWCCGDGKRYKAITCPKCNGCGCAECCGFGEVSVPAGKCARCWGTGTDVIRHVPGATHGISDQYGLLVDMLPGVEYTPADRSVMVLRPLWVLPNPETEWRFRFHGGQALICETEFYPNK